MYNAVQKRQVIVQLCMGLLPCRKALGDFLASREGCTC